MRSLVMAFFFFQSALGAAITEAFVSLSADPLLVWVSAQGGTERWMTDWWCFQNYVAAAIIAFLGGCVTWILFRHLDAQEDELNAISDKAHIDHALTRAPSDDVEKP